MLIVISPAKTLDFEKKAHTQHFSNTDFLPSAAKLHKVLKKYKADDLRTL